MNIDFIKEKIVKLLGKKVKVTVSGMRNRFDFYEGIVYRLYPNFFTILYNGEEKSFNYRDILTKDVNISIL